MRIVRVRPGETLTFNVAYNQPFILLATPIGATNAPVTGGGNSVESSGAGPVVPQVTQSSTGGSVANGGLTSGTRPGTTEGNADARNLEQITALRDIRNAALDTADAVRTAGQEAKASAGRASNDAAAADVNAKAIKTAVDAATAAINAAKTEGLAQAQTLNQQLENSIEFVGADIVQAIEEAPPPSSGEIPTVEDVPVEEVPLPTVPDLGPNPSTGDIAGELGQTAPTGYASSLEGIGLAAARSKNALADMAGRLGLNQNISSVPWTFSFNVPIIGSVVFDVEEEYGWALDMIRLFLAFMLSVWFVQQLISSTRESVA